MPRKLLLTLLTLGALIVPAAARAAVLPGETGGYGITPARRDLFGRPPMTLSPTLVLDGTTSPYKVTVFPVLLTQSLSGAFVFSSAPRDLNAAKLVLSVAPDSFTLPAGGRRLVSLHWNQLPLGQNWTAIGVIFQGVAQNQSGPVHVISRLLSVNFLSLPGFNRIDGQFTGLYSQQFGKQVLRFVARVKNTGNRVAAPTHAELAIRDSTGQTVFSEPWKGDVIVPGAQRDYDIDVTKVLAAGAYTATVSMSFGGSRSRSTAFRLVGPNELPTPAVSIGDFNATGVIGSPAKLSARIASTGTAPASVTLHLFLGRAGAVPGSPALASGAVTYSNLAPGAVMHLARPLGQPLKKGSYRAILTWTDPTGAPHLLEADFTATAAHGFFEQIWLFIKNHAGVFLGLLILALLLAMAFLLQKMRQRQKRVEAELAAARARLAAPVGEGPSPAGGATHPLPVDPLPVAVAPEPEPEPEPGRYLPVPVARPVNGARRKRTRNAALALGALGAFAAWSRTRRR